MSSSTTSWIEHPANAPKRKRAGLVCVACHEKKIKCDLQIQGQSQNTGFKRCSHCITSGQECRVRASKRGNRRGSRPPPPLQSSSPVVDSQTVNDAERALCTPPRSTSTDERVITGYPQSSVPPRSNEAYPAFTHGGNYLYPMLTANHNEIPATSQLGLLLSMEQSQSESSPQSSRHTNSEVFLSESGFLQVYSQEHRDYTNGGQGTVPAGESLNLDLPEPDLLQSFTETYFKSCYAWCPVLDRETLTSDLARSPLLVNALSLAGSHIQPAILPSTKPATYYRRAKQMFYNDEEADPISSLQAISLFYWWCPRPSLQVQKDAAWWWAAVGIRQAQQMGIHREPKLGHSSAMDRGLRRRIWWTLFARERITAICQGRPCLIDPEDCNLPEPTLDDFPDPTNPKAEIFIYWVRLCVIIGRVAKYRSRVSDVSSLAFPAHLANELIKWAQSLPQHLKLPIEINRITNFDPDIHQLHLPYLAVIIILHLSPSSQPLPRAYVAAVMAASCIARIFKDYLTRGGIRFLMPVAGWICGIATLALLRASRLDQLTRHAEEDIKVLVIALKELRVYYPVADMFLQGFERLRAESASAGDDDDFYADRSDPSVTTSEGIDWTRYFPFITAQTSGLAGVLLTKQNNALFLDETWLGLMPLQLQEPFGLYESFSGYMPVQ